MQYSVQKILFTWTILLIPLLSFPQGKRIYKFERISSENSKLERGLSQNSINCIIQDRKGLIWFGTWDGLNKYDGYTYTIYKPDFIDMVNGPVHQTIRCLLEDESGLIWIGTDKGLSCFNRKNETFSHYSFSKNIEQKSFDTIWTIVEGRDNSLWLGTSNGLYRFNKQKKTFRIFQNIPNRPNSLCNNHINQLYTDRAGMIWISTNKGVSVLNPENEQFSLPVISGKPSSYFDYLLIHCTYEDKKGNIWIGTQNGLFCIQYQSKKLAPYYSKPSGDYGLSNNDITALYEDWFGLLWIGTNGGGINLLNFTDNRFVKMNYSPVNLNSLSNDFISCIYEDKAGIIWVGTAWKGANKIDRNSHKFNHYYHVADNSGSLNSNLVWAISEDNQGSAWIGTDEGINILDRKTEQFVFLKHNPGNPNSLSSNSIRTILHDKNGKVWIGTWDAGMDKYDPVTRKFTHFIPKTGQNSISDFRILKIMEDKSGIIWIGTANGLDRFDPATGVFKHFRHITGNPNSLPDNNVLSVYEDSKGFLWISTYHGLCKFDKKTEKFTVYLHIPGNRNSLSNNSVFSVTEDRLGIIWICTMGGGLNRFDPLTETFTAFTEKDGLPNNVVYAALEDNKGNLWLSTNFGLAKFDVRGEVFINYDVEDGIQSNEFNNGAVFKNKSGELFFGGMNGFNLFSPNEIRKNQNIPPILFTSFKIFNIEQPIELNDKDTIWLTWRDNFFSIGFSALDFTNPSKNKYMYMLEKYNQDWIRADATQRIAQYTKVSPGTYTFRVKGSNNDGFWNETGISLTIIILPAWYNRWAFRIVALIIVFIAVTLFVFLRFKRIRKKHEVEKKLLKMEKELTEIQQKTLRLQMNPHFIFNSLNSIQHFIIEKDEESAHIYLSNFSSLMRKILENSKYNLISLSEEIETIRLYLELEKLRFEERFDYHFSIDSEISLSRHRIPPMLIQPYLENAIWHGLMPKEVKGNLWISISREGHDSIVVVIRDDGIGREKAGEIAKKRKSHKSTGMKNIEDRIALMNDLSKTKMRVEITDLFDENHQPAGTEVRLTITNIYSEN